jgi:hypothetical protein
MLAIAMQWLVVCLAMTHHSNMLMIAVHNDMVTLDKKEERNNENED